MSNSSSALDQASQAYFDAVTKDDLEAVVNAFASEAEIIDVNRSIKGHQAIRTWASNEVMGGTYRILGATPYEGGIDILVEFTPPGASSGFRASYKFDVTGDKISHANLQYAD